jgi:hypothetical protein
MGAQEHVALARSWFDLYNSHQSDPSWLDKSIAAFAADSEVVDIPSGTTGNCPETSTLFALKQTHVPRILHMRTTFPGEAAPHQASSIDIL